MPLNLQKMVLLQFVFILKRWMKKPFVNYKKIYISVIIAIIISVVIAIIIIIAVMIIV